VNHTITIEYLHYRQHCSVRGHCLFCFLIKKYCWEALSFMYSVPKVVRFDLTAKPKSFPTDTGSSLTATPSAIRSASQPDPRLLDSALSQIQICQFLVFLPLWIFFSFSLIEFFFIQWRKNKWWDMFILYYIKVGW
jgi:hypothetical protein